MVAIALPTTPALDRSRRQLPSGGTGRGHLALVAGTARRPATPAIGRAVLAAVLALAVVLAGAYLARTPEPAPGRAATTTTYVAAEGDTMWSIAVAHAPAGEAATYVEALVDANGGATVTPGQALTLPRP